MDLKSSSQSNAVCTVAADAVVEARRHQHGVVLLPSSLPLVFPPPPPHLLPLPPPLLLALPHHTDLLLHQRLAAEGAQLEEGVGREGALLALCGDGGGAEAELGSAANDQVGRLHHDHVGGRPRLQAGRPIGEAADGGGEHAAPGGGAVGLQDDDVVGRHLVVDGAGQRGAGGRRDGQGGGTASRRSRR